MKYEPDSLKIVISTKMIATYQHENLPVSTMNKNIGTMEIDRDWQVLLKTILVLVE